MKIIIDPIGLQKDDRVKENEIQKVVKQRTATKEMKSELRLAIPIFGNQAPKYSLILPVGDPSSKQTHQMNGATAILTNEDDIDMVELPQSQTSRIYHLEFLSLGTLWLQSGSGYSGECSAFYVS